MKPASPAPTRAAGGGGGALVAPLFAAATFLGAFLLFLVQPLIARYILPWFGGGAAVWTTCMLFFQTVLLGGYLYAHLGVKRLGPRAQSAVHVVLLLAAAGAALPMIAPSARWQPPAGGAAPVGRILLLLGATVGLPCLVLAATSPLLQAWYARVRPASSVYRLYALSNAGSLLALLAYPLAVEPLMPRRAQAIGWTVAMVVFAALCSACAWVAARHAGSADAPGVTGATEHAEPQAAGPGVTRVVLWLALPACAAALLLGTTNTITQEIAPVPLLWVVPLALYLLTFIIAFDHPRWYRRGAWGWLLVVTAGGAVVLLARGAGGGAAGSIEVVASVLAAAMFVGCMVLHGELARLKPPPRQLTAYYLAVSAGGALGGLLVAVGAPLVLKTYAELPASLWTCCLLAFVAVHLDAHRPPIGLRDALAIAGITALGAFSWAAAHRAEPGGTPLASSRDFYGALSAWAVEDDAGRRGTILRHGAILHGQQFTAPPELRARPTTYFHPGSGLGRVLGGDDSPLPRPRRVAVVGLGPGTIAAYAGVGDAYRFYELSPGVVRYAREHFTYLADAAARGAAVDVVVGDGRLSLEREQDQRLDVLVLDAFSGVAVPVHLLTREAFDLYRRHLAPGGVLCVHVSNKHVDLAPVVAAAARRLGWHAVLVQSPGDSGGRRGGDATAFAADWILLSPDASRLARFAPPAGQPLDEYAPDFAAWTDERADILRVIRR